MREHPGTGATSFSTQSFQEIHTPCLTPRLPDVLSIIPPVPAVAAATTVPAFAASPFITLTCPGYFVDQHAENVVGANLGTDNVDGTLDDSAWNIGWSWREGEYPKTAGVRCFWAKVTLVPMRKSGSEWVPSNDPNFKRVTSTHTLLNDHERGVRVMGGRVQNKYWMPQVEKDQTTGVVSYAGTFSVNPGDGAWGMALVLRAQSQGGPWYKIILEFKEIACEGSGYNWNEPADGQPYEVISNTCIVDSYVIATPDKGEKYDGIV